MFLKPIKKEKKKKVFLKEVEQLSLVGSLLNKV